MRMRGRSSTHQHRSHVLQSGISLLRNDGILHITYTWLPRSFFPSYSLYTTIGSPSFPLTAPEKIKSLIGVGFSATDSAGSIANVSSRTSRCCKLCLRLASEQSDSLRITRAMQNSSMLLDMSKRRKFGQGLGLYTHQRTEQSDAVYVTERLQGHPHRPPGQTSTQLPGLYLKHAGPPYLEQHGEGIPLGYRGPALQDSHNPITA